VDPELEQNEALVEEHPLVAACFLQIELEFRFIELAFDSSGDNFGVPTPAGKALPNSLKRSDIPCRAL